MPKYDLRRIPGCLFLSVIMFAGCSSLQLPEYERQSFDRYPYSQIQGEFAVAVNPLTDEKEVTEYFGMDLLSANILAVFVVAENRSASSSFLLSKKQFTLGGLPPSSAGTRDELQIEKASTAEILYWVGLGSPVLLLISTKMGSDVREVRHNFALKELQTVTLSPGEKTQGFIYFSLQNADVSLNQWSIHLDAVELQSKSRTSFDIPFAWERK